MIYSAFIRDVSERRAMEGALSVARRLAEQRERLADIGAITARIVHDLGNPLAGLSMQAQLIQRRVTRNPDRPSQDLAAPAERIVTEVRRLDALVKDFLDFARQQRLDVRTIALPPFLQRVIDLWQPVAAARDIALTLELAPELTELNGDEEKLRRVLDNLVKNAVEAIDHGPGRVGVQAPARRRARAHHGHGRRSGHAAERRDVQALRDHEAQRLGPRALDLEADRPRARRQHRFRAPRAARHRLPRRPARPVPPPCNAITVVVVDDDASFRSGVAANLEDDGHVVLQYEDPRDVPAERASRRRTSW